MSGDDNDTVALATVTIRRLLVAVATLGALSAGVARAEDASVLPKGVGRLTLENLFYLPVENRFNPHGGAAPIAGDFDNRHLDSTVFSLLKPLNPFVAGGNASIGDSQLKFTYNYDILELGGQYGLTDRLTVGIDLPYFWASNDVKANLNTGPGTSTNVGLRTGAPLGPCAAAVVPLTCGAFTGVRKFTTDDVQNLLGRGLQTPSGVFIPGFGFKRIHNWFGDGLGDITVGGKYQYLRTEDWQLATTLGARFPTGRQHDPDSLSDVYWSTGAYALLLRLHSDYTLSNLWRKTPPAPTTGPAVSQPGDLSVNGTFKFDLVLPDYATVRVSSDVTNPITTNRELVYRELGDRFEVEFGAKYELPNHFSLFGAQYELPRGLSLSALYRYGWKLSDVVVGHRGFAYETLTAHTDSTEQIYIVSIAYSTVPLYLEKKFPVPMGISLSYRDRFAGYGPRAASSPSQVLNSQYIDLGIQVLF